MVILASQAIVANGPGITASETTQQKNDVISQVGYTILFDEAHTSLGSASMTPGNSSYLGWMLEENGYDCEMNFDQLLDSGILGTVDALILVFPMVSLTTNEITAVHDFVEAGGDLLLIGTDDSDSWHFSSANLNPVSEIYGITFNMDSWLATTTNLIAHHLTQDVSSIHSNMDYKLKGCTLNVVSPATTVATYQGNPVAAVSEAGTGKVVAVGALAPFLQYRDSDNWQVELDDLWQFSLNIFDWFAGVTPRKVNVPETAIITIGPGPSLSPAELDNYSAYTGIIHDHTTHSDGQGTPMEMTWAAYTRGMDFMVMTDHSYDVPITEGRTGGITGALACRDITEGNGLNLEIYIGAELSHGQHSMAFPLTSNVIASTQTEMVEGAHAQGAMIALCHPTISAQYMDAYSKWDAFGYDAIEVDNSGYTHGLMDEGYTRPFYGASDYHNPDRVGDVVNVAFVENPSGPNGKLTDMDLVSAILEKRIVIVDFQSDLIYGQKVWVDRYLELKAEAETEISNAEDAIDLVSITSNQTLLADLYLRDAVTGLHYGNPARAIRASLEAQTIEALGITIEIANPIPRILDPLENYILSLNITNNIGQGVEFNTTIFRTLEVTVDTINEMAIIPSGSSILLNKSQECGDTGYVLTAFNLHDFNTTSYLSPTLFGVGGLIHDGSFNPEYTIGYSGTNVTGMVPINRGDIRFLTSATFFYNDGDGWKNISMSIKTVTIEVTIGPYLKGTVIDFWGVAYDIFGGAFVIEGYPFMITSDPLEPTSNNGPGGGIPIDPILLAVIGGSIVVVIMIVVIVMKKRGF